MPKKRLFVDLDGTCAEWKNLRLEVNIDRYEKATPEEIEKEVQRQVYDILHSKDYFYNLKPYQNMCDAVNKIVNNNSDEIEVYILSAAISETAINDKNRWVDKYMPGIPLENRIYTKDGDDKSKYIKGGLLSSDTFLDDYNVNLNACDPPATSIKLLNQQNSAETWNGNRIRYDKSGDEIARDIVSIVKRERTIQDKAPSLSLDELIRRNSKSRKDNDFER